MARQRLVDDAHARDVERGGAGIEARRVCCGAGGLSLEVEHGDRLGLGSAAAEREQPEREQPERAAPVHGITSASVCGASPCAAMASAFDITTTTRGRRCR